ncbi:MAG: O-antigen ligase family protein [Pirellulaceae bacterium]
MAPLLVNVSRAAVLVPVLALPWLFGGVQGIAQWAMALSMLIGVLSYTVACYLNGGSDEVPLSGAVVPLMLALALGVLQLLPFPYGGLLPIAPQNAAIWGLSNPTQNERLYGVVREELPEADAALCDVEPLAPTISLYPAETRHQLALLLLGVSVFFLASRVFQRPQWKIIALAAMTINGTALAFFGITQKLTWDGKLYGVIPLEGGSPFASYVNRNHAANFLNLALGCAFGLAVYVFARRSTAGELPVRHPDAPLRAIARASQSAGPWGRRWSARLRSGVARISAGGIFCVVAVATISGGVVSALSRGGWLSGAVAAVFAAVAVLVSSRAAGRVLAVSLSIVLGLILIDQVGLTDSVSARAQSVSAHDLLRDGRLGHWSVALQTAVKFLPFGSGLGTHGYAYRMLQDTPEATWFRHAENTYLEAFVEAGLAGPLLLLAAVIAVGAACWHLLREPHHTAGFAVGLAGAFALISQAIHGLFDFAMYLPANMAVFALVSGLACGRSARIQYDRRHSENARRQAIDASRRRWWRRLLLIQVRGLSAKSLATALAFGTLLALVELSTVANVELASRDLPRIDAEQEPPTKKQVESAIQRLGIALADRNDDAEGQLRLAELWLDLFRLRRVREVKGENAKPEKNDWIGTLPVALHQLAHESPPEAIWRQAPSVKEDLTVAALRLRMARRACPLLPQPHLLLAELAPVFSWLGHEETHLNRLRQVAGARLNLLKEASVLDWNARRIGDGLDAWRTLGGLSPDLLPGMLRFLADNSTNEEREESMIRVLPEKPSLLAELAADEFSEEKDSGIRRLLVKRAESLVTEGSDEPDQLFAQGMCFWLKDQRPERAVSLLERAVKASPPNRHQWRYHLAQVYYQSGDLERARDYVGRCVAVAPDNQRYQRLQKEVIHAGNSAGK